MITKLTKAVEITFLLFLFELVGILLLIPPIGLYFSFTKAIVETDTDSCICAEQQLETE